MIGTIRRHRVARALTLLASLTCPLAGASAQALLETSSLEDSFAPTVQVSGGVNVGLLTGRTEGYHRFNPGSTLWVLVPAGVQGPLCISVDSADGRYHGRFRLAEDNMPPPGPAGLQLVSIHGDKLETMKGEELVALVTVPERRADGTVRCGEGIDAVLLASWTGPGDWNDFSVFVNSGRYSTRTVIRFAGSDATQAFDCVSAEVPTPVAYDKVCRISGLASGSTIETIEIRRKRYMKNLAPVVLRLRR